MNKEKYFVPEESDLRLGYEYERYIAYSWLKTEITNTLSDKTHEVVKNLNKPYDEK